MQANNDINLVGADIAASEKLALTAGDNVNISSAVETVTSSYDKKRRSVSDPLSEQYTGTQKEKTVTFTNVGSILTGNEVSISAGNNIDVTASVIAANTDISLDAGNNVSIGAAQDVYHGQSKTEEYGIDPTMRFGVAGTKTADTTITKDVGSEIISGGNISVNAGGGIDVKASSIYGDGDVGLNATGDITIAAGEARLVEKSRTDYAGYSETTTATEDKISSFSGVTYTNNKKESTQTVALSSNVRSGGNLSINSSDENVTVRGSNLASGADTAISAGRDISFEVADQIDKHREEGTTIAVGALAEAEQTFTRTIRDAVDLATSAYEKAKGIDGDNYADLDSKQGVVGTVRDAYKAYKNIDSAATGGLNVSIKVGGTIGVSDVKITRDNNSELASSAVAGGDINLDAGRDVNMRGTQLAAASDVNISAGENLNISAALDERDEYMRSTEASVFGGVAGQAGTNGTALGFRVEVGAGNEKAEFTGKVYTNAHVTAGQTLNVSTGNNASIVGGNLKGDEVNMNIGGGLTLASVQNKIESSSSGVGAKIGFTFGFGAAGSGGSIGEGAGDNVASQQPESASNAAAKSAFGFNRGQTNANLSYSTVSSNFVGEQSSIEGASKVDIYVGGNTHLKGSLINAENGNLKLDTETLTYEDIKSRERGLSLGGGIEIAGTSSPEYNSTLVDTTRNKKNNASGSSGGEAATTPKSDEDKNLFDNISDAGKKLQDKINEAKETVKNGARDAAGNLLDHRDVDIVIGWVGDGAGHVADAFEPVNDYLKSMQTRPVNLSFGYSEKEQLARATIGSGEITIRSNPDQDISDLNRDPAKSFVVIDKPLFGIKNETIRERIENINIKDPVKSITDGIDIVGSVKDTAKNIGKQGGIKNYLDNKTTTPSTKNN